uniref:Dynein axonemal intermediate chain 7 n=1 Tax=Sphenodon punctatus TaxID=8508 RepID=A0A8D0HR00_SPHPU
EAERLEKERTEQEERERLEAKVKVGAFSVWLYFPFKNSHQWEHYTDCNGSPDPMIPQEINTFMSLWREKRNEDIKLVMENGKHVLMLIEKLEYQLLDMPVLELCEKEVVQYQDSIMELRSLLHQKYNEATEDLLKKASTFADSDSGNMEVLIRDENVTFCIWANLKKNPRYINGFDLPKLLAMCDVAIRILHTHYDHVSPLRRIPTLTLKVEPPENKELLTVLYDVKEEREQEQKNDEEDRLSPQKETHLEEPPKPGETKTERRKLSLLHMDNDREEQMADEDTVDLRQYTPVGGVYHVDALKLPPQARHIKGWTMVELLEEGLETYPYPPETEDTEDDSSQPIGLTVKLLDSVIYFEEPLVARWHSEGKLWRIDGITDVKYKMKDKEVYFKMAAFYTITLLQDAHLNMPYQSWELRPNGTDEALLTVLTAFTEVQIQIKVNQCMLASVTIPEESQETELLSHLRGKWMTPLGLTIALKTAGINIFPAEYSHKYVSVNKKLPATELAAYQQIALVASAFAFGWSKWNLECGEDRVIFKVSEHLKEGPVQDEDWSLYMFNSQRAQRLRITEHSEAFSEDLAERTEFHSTLFHMIKDFATEAAVEKVKCTHYLFIDAVFQLLFAIRVLTYS